METNTCPVCQCVATFHGKRDHGEISRYCCPRCGKFQITGTALSMLKGRLSGVGNRYARLSHAIRRNQEEGDVWFQVTSVNIDELVDSPLPDITAQIENLIRWALRILGDDQLGSVDQRFRWPRDLIDTSRLEIGKVAQQFETNNSTS